MCTTVYKTVQHENSERTVSLKKREEGSNISSLGLFFRSLHPRRCNAPPCRDTRDTHLPPGQAETGHVRFRNHRCRTQPRFHQRHFACGLRYANQREKTVIITSVREGRKGRTTVRVGEDDVESGKRSAIYILRCHTAVGDESLPRLSNRTRPGFV